MIMKFGKNTPDTVNAAFIAPDADVIGDVTLGKDSSVWFGAVLRGDTGSITIGEGSNIQDNCTVHCDLGFSVSIGKNVTVGHNAVVHGATVGDNTVVGMQSTILNGAVIGSNCMIGAGALVTEKTVVPDNTLVVGVPAVVKAQIDEKRAVMLAMNAKYYAAEAKKYAEALKADDV